MAGYSLHSGSLLVSVVCVLVVLSVLPGSSEGQTVRRPNPRSCGEAGLCCQGQNNTCFVFGKRVDRSDDSKRCYCDSNCLIMGDCCMDYHHTCKSVDCTVGQWEQWSECDNSCGYGSRRRRRHIVNYPDNGGKFCPVLKQRRACVGYKQEICEQNLIGSQEEEKRERARILPINLGAYRTQKKYNPWKGILKNLYDKYFNQVFTRATYRAQFRVTATHHGCEKKDWTSYLKVNTTVCVECQPVAMNKEIGMRCMGHGVYKANTAWNAVDVPHCHGMWEMISMHEPQVCDYDLEDERNKNFIFI